MNCLRNITPALIEEYNIKFDEWDKYLVSEKTLKRIINGYPKNDQIEFVLAKVCLLNDLYGTNIFNTVAVAKHIVKLNIDDRLKSGDIQLVEDVARISLSGKEKYFYSFATKYCSWHNEGIYPIYDSYVDKLLRAYRKQEKFCSFKNEELRVYRKYVNILKDLMRYYNIEEVGFKELDKFLWMYGKENFRDQ